MKTDKNISTILEGIANNEKLKGDVSFNEIIIQLGPSAFGVAILFFALPSALPLSAIPGISVIFSLPIFFIAIQMIFLKKSIWLPEVLRKKTISHTAIVNITKKATPTIKKIETLLKPRLLFMISPVMEVINGFVLAILSVLLMLPIPFSNFILAALIIIFSLGLLEKDGVFIIAGFIGTILYASFVYGIILATLKLVF